MSALVALRGYLHALTERLAFASPLLARLVVGVVFVLSGWGKLHNLDQVARFFASLGVPFPELQAPFVAAIELVCGAAVLAGFATRLAALPLIGTMVVALATALASRITGANALFGLAEFLYIVLLVQLAIGGAGPVSLDRFSARWLDRVPAERRA
jgi:putative oxidoreductase